MNFQPVDRCRFGNGYVVDKTFQRLARRGSAKNQVTSLRIAEISGSSPYHNSGLAPHKRRIEATQHRPRPTRILGYGPQPVVRRPSSTGTRHPPRDRGHRSRASQPAHHEASSRWGEDYWNTQATGGDASFAGYYDHPSLAALSMCSTPERSRIRRLHRQLLQHRPDLDAVLLTGVPAGLFTGFRNNTGTTKADMLRLNVAIKPTATAKAAILGVVAVTAPVPNGRRVFDDVVSIELKAVAGACSATS